MRSHTKDRFPDRGEMDADIGDHEDLKNAMRNQELLMSILDNA